MKRILPGLCALCFPVLARAAVPSQPGETVPVLWTASGGNFTTFYLQTNQISTSKAWTGNTPFPVELSDAAQRARTSIQNPSEEQTEVSLVKVDIRRLDMDTNMVPADCLPSDPTNQWMLAFEFLLSPPPRTKFAAMMLDGTLATATNGIRPRISRAFSPGLATAATQNDTSAHEAWRAIYRPDFAVPSRQWSPFSEKFPLDLQSLVSQAARRAPSVSRKETQEKPRLEEICMETYLPAQALNARGMDFRENLHHWIVTFRFTQGASTENAYALLDGRILE